jgi:DNA polymerase-4
MTNRTGEQRDHPEWRGRPLVVGAQPGQRGVVATCSYEARRFGVHSAMPIAQAAGRLPPETLYVRPRMAQYAQVSEQIMAVLAGFSPLVERVSIDEAYLDVTGLEALIGPTQVIGARIKAGIRQAVGLTASIGIGPNRLIAKLASDVHKPDGLTLIPDAQVADFLAPMPFSVLRGLGKKTAPRLARLGVKTIGDVRQLSLETLRRQCGARAGTQFYYQARGIADDQIYPERARQSISKEVTFPEDVTDPRLLEETLRWAAREVAWTARQTGHLGRVVRLKMRFFPFETHTRSRSLKAPTADEQEVFRTAWAMLAIEAAWAGRPVRLIGVGLSGWSDTTADRQLDLFATTEAERNRADNSLTQTLDAIRHRFGAEAIQRGLGTHRH